METQRITRLEDIFDTSGRLRAAIGATIVYGAAFADMATGGNVGSAVLEYAHIASSEPLAGKTALFVIGSIINMGVAYGLYRGDMSRYQSYQAYEKEKGHF